MHCLYFTYARKIYVRARVKIMGQWKSTYTEIAPKSVFLWVIFMSLSRAFHVWVHSSAKTALQLHNYDMPFHILWRLMDNVNTRPQVFCSLFKLIALAPCKRIKSSAPSLLCVVGFYQCLICVLTFSCSIAVCRWRFCFQEKEASWLSFSGSHWYWGYGVPFDYRAVLLLRLHARY